MPSFALDENESGQFITYTLLYKDKIIISKLSTFTKTSLTSFKHIVLNVAGHAFTNISA